MVQHLSDNELERIAEFANTPTYDRNPEQLLPENDSKK